MTDPIDFSQCERLPSRAYNGANGKKIAVRYDGDVWLVKFPPSAADKPTALSYTNSCLCEHIASSIANMIGLKAHETRLGTFTNGKTKVVCGCRDFTANGKILYDFCSIKNTVIDSETGGTGTELDDVLETIDLQAFVDPVSLKAHFWDMFVVDAFLGNFDRHNGNWGFLVDPVTNKTEIAPAFDFGSCLLPQADDEVMRRVINDKAERDTRIYNFPASALKENGKKIGYVDFFRRHAGDLLAPSLARIAPRIDLAAISTFIDGVPFLTDLQRTFYKVYLTARHEALFVQQAHDFLHAGGARLLRPSAEDGTEERRIQAQQLIESMERNARHFGGITWKREDLYDRFRELPPSAPEITGILPADIDVEKAYHEHLEEKYQ